MKIYALDSNIISYALRGDATILGTLPSYVYYEVGRGLAAKKAVVKQAAFNHLCEKFTMVEFDRTAFDIAIGIYTTLRASGSLIDDGDILIACVCIRHGMTLVTANERHFTRISGLSYENWV